MARWHCSSARGPLCREPGVTCGWTSAGDKSWRRLGEVRPSMGDNPTALAVRTERLYQPCESRRDWTAACCGIGLNSPAPGPVSIPARRRGWRRDPDEPLTNVRSTPLTCGYACGWVG